MSKNLRWFYLFNRPSGVLYGDPGVCFQYRIKRPANGVTKRERTSGVRPEFGRRILQRKNRFYYRRHGLYGQGNSINISIEFVINKI